MAVAKGLPTTTALAGKLWQAAKIQGHKNPFGKALLDHTVAELDFVLEMEALDNPKGYVFKRGGVSSDGSHVPEAKAAWASALRGSALARYLSGIPFKAVQAYRERVASTTANRGQAGMKPGIKEGKVPPSAPVRKR